LLRGEGGEVFEVLSKFWDRGKRGVGERGGGSEEKDEVFGLRFKRQKGKVDIV